MGGNNDRLTGPALFRLIKNVNSVEASRILFFERVKLFAEEDISGGDVGKDEGELGLVFRLSEGVGDDLSTKGLNKRLHSDWRNVAYLIHWCSKGDA